MTDPTMTSWYDHHMVILSVLIAVGASYAALDLSARIAAAQGTLRLLWLVGGATAMGQGIWSMHYIGMLAFHLPVMVRYNLPLVALSLIAAIVSSAIALYVVSREQLRKTEALAGAVVMGAGIGAMHYVGMAAMRLSAACHYNPWIVSLSVIIAIVVSLVALALTFHLRHEAKNISWLKVASAVVMGVAIAAMHYTGMAAVTYTAPADSLVKDDPRSISISSLGAAGIGAVALILLTITILTSLVDRRFSAQALELESSERRYRVLFKSAPIGVFRANMDGHILEINETGSKILGYGPANQPHGATQPLEADVLARSGLATPEYELRLGEEIRGLKTSMPCRPFEIEHVHKDGSHSEALVALAVMDAPKECVGFAVDLTEHKRAEAELAESKAKLEAVLEAATQIAIIATDTKGNITVFNTGAECMLGYCAEEIIGKNAATLHVASELETCGEELGRQLGYLVEGFDVLIEAASHGAYEEREWTYIRKDGTKLAVSLGVTALQDWQGNMAGFLEVAKDITERKRVEEELKSALQMKSDFVSFATHQLRTPLAGIKWLLELAVQDEGIPEEPRSLVQDAREAADRLIRLVNDLLDASRLEGGKLTLDPKYTNLGELTRSVLNDVNHQIETQGHKLSIHGAEEIPLVQVDPQLFRQVILNLISNAVKYTPPGGTITIEMSQDNGSVLWSIRDNGIGIPKMAQARLFEKFFRADNVYKVETEGTGLGLYLVRLVVERSGGKVWCESDEGQGTIFKFQLPLRVRDET